VTEKAAPRPSPSIGLALGSGGARGLAHIGVIQVLEEHEVVVDVVTGSSIGALVGALYCSGSDGVALHRIASDTTLLKIIPLFDPSLRHGFLGGTKLERLIKEFVGGRRVEECRIPLAVIATDLRSGEVVVYREGDLASVVRASISVPWVFRPVEIDGRLLADGGLSMPVPAEPARDIGADVVIAVDLDWERPFSDPSDAQAPGAREMGNRSLALLRRHLAAQDARRADVVVRPRFGREIRWDRFLDPDEPVDRGREAMVAEMTALETTIATWRRQNQRRRPGIPRGD
jgi:NTE family protein